MNDKIKEWFPIFSEKIKTWKDLILLFTSLLMVLGFNFLMRIDVKKYVKLTKEDIATEIVTKHDKLVTKIISISPKIDKLLNNTLDEINNTYGFNRSIIFIYHNNITMTNGIPYIRMSISHERIKEDKINVQDEYLIMQNVPTSIFAHLNGELLKYGYVCETIDNLKKVDRNTYERFLKDHITGYVAILLRNDDGTPLATLMSFSYDDKLCCSLQLEHDLKIHAKSIKESLKYELDENK